MFEFFSPLTKNIGIDLGTSNSHVFVERRGIILSEPSIVVAIGRDRNVVAVGEEALRLLGRTPEMITVHKPLQDGVIADYYATKMILSYFIDKAIGHSMNKPRVMLGIPAGTTSVEKRAVLDAVMQAGAREAYLLETAVAAAIGADLPIFEPRGSMIVDIGGGTTDVATLSLGGVAVSVSAKVGGLDMDAAIERYLKYKFNAMVGAGTPEAIKLAIGTAVLPMEDKLFRFSGRDLTDGLPKEMSIQSSEVYEVLQNSVRHILAIVRSVLEKTPPELAADIKDCGIVLTGGGAQLRGLADLFSSELGVPVRVAENPMYAVAIGTGRALKNRERLSGVIEGAKRLYRRRF